MGCKKLMKAGRAAAVGAASTLLDGLISYWTLDEASGQRQDSHGTNHLTDNNTVTQEAGILGTAAKFTSANSEYLSAADNDGLSVNGSQDFTFACWFWLDTKPAEAWIAGKDDGTREWVLRYLGGGTDRLSFGLTSGNVTATAFGSPTTGTWIHVICWRDTAAAKIRIRVNGGAVNEAADMNPSAGSSRFILGSQAGSAAFHNGRIDGAYFAKRVLTEAEQDQLYGAGSPPEYPFS